MSSTAKIQRHLGEKRKLPDGWRWVKLGEIASIISKGTTPTTLGLQYTDVGIPFLRAEDVNGRAIEIDKVTFHISNDADETLARSRLLPGDFLITIAGSIGRVGYVPSEVPHLNCNQAVAFARFDQGIVDVQYLCFVCSLEHIISPLLDQKAGGALQNLNLQQIRHLEIPLPPISEQKRIAGVLKEQMAAVGNARAAAQARLEAVKALPAALLRQVFPQPGQTLPDGWRWVKLGDVCMFRRGPFGGSLRKEIFVASGYAVYEQMHAIYNDFSKFRYYIDQEKFDEMRGFKVCQGDLIMSCSGTMGKVAIIPGNAPEGVINQALLKLTPQNDISCMFLKTCMESANFQKNLAVLTLGAAIKNVASVGVLKAMRVPLPPLPEQRRIAGVLKEQMAATNKAREAAEEELDTINALPASLLRRAFAGEL